MKIKAGKWIIESDISKTRTYYESIKDISYNCDCIYCRNYEEATKQFSTDVKRFFDELGIIPKKTPGEIFHCSETTCGKHLSRLNCHLHGAAE